MPIPLILGGAALLGAGGIGGARLLKDELDMGADAAAREELAQGKKKGYNPEGGGQIKRGYAEKFRDILMGNSQEDILQAAREGQAARQGSAL